MSTVTDKFFYPNTSNKSFEMGSMVEMGSRAGYRAGSEGSEAGQSINIGERVAMPTWPWVKRQAGSGSHSSDGERGIGGGGIGGIGGRHAREFSSDSSNSARGGTRPHSIHSVEYNEGPAWPPSGVSGAYPHCGENGLGSAVRGMLDRLNNGSAKKSESGGAARLSSEALSQDHLMYMVRYGVYPNHDTEPSVPQ